MRQNAAISLLPITLLFAAMLGASLGFKAWMTNFDSVADARRLQADLTALLHHQGYAVTLRDSHYLGPVFVASKGSCRLELRDATDAQGMEDALARDALGHGRLSFAWAGQPYASMPFSRVQWAEWKQRSLARLGFDSAITPVFSLVKTDQCRFGPENLAGIRRYYHTAMQ
jgi:hypothetical protein